MNRRIIIIIAAIIIGILLFYFIVIPLIGAVPLSASMRGQWYNGDTPVGNPFAFVNPGGTEVDHVSITVSWVATGTSVDVTTFGLSGTVKCYIDQPYPGFEKTLLSTVPFHYSGENGMVDDSTAHFHLDTILSGFMDWKDVGWTLVFEGHLDASITDVNDDSLTSTWDGSISYRITWSEISGTFSLTGTITII